MSCFRQSSHFLPFMLPVLCVSLCSCVRYAITVLLDLKPSSTASYVSELQQPSILPHAPGPQLSPLFSFFQFPSYFSKLYSFLRMLKQWRTQPPGSAALMGDAGLTAEEGLMQTMCIDGSFMDALSPTNNTQQPSQLVSLVAQLLPQLLPILDAEAFSTLLLPHLMPLFSTTRNSSKIAAEAMCRLFDILSRRLGPIQTSRFFLKPLFDLFELMLHPQSADDDRSLALLLNTGFLNQVSLASSFLFHVYLYFSRYLLVSCDCTL